MYKRQWQVRRIATGDALASSVVGLVLGAGFFLLVRAFVEHVELFELRIFSSDLTPSVGYVALVAVLVPVLSVLAALATMRGTTVDPLGVARRAKPPARRLWWRVVPVLVGVAVLATRERSLADWHGSQGRALLLGGIALLLLGIPLLLPWVVERSVGRVRGGPPSWQLAVRGLQMDSGSAARVVGGVAVVLAGGIALQTVLLGTETEVKSWPPFAPVTNQVDITVLGDAVTRVDELADRVRGVDGVVSVSWQRSFGLLRKGGDRPVEVGVESCDVLLRGTGITSCRDGDAFVFRGSPDDSVIPEPGEVVLQQRYTQLGRMSTGAEWTVPALTAADRPDGQLGYHPVVLTPGAVRGVGVESQIGGLRVLVDPAVPTAARNARAALGDLGWQATGLAFDQDPGDPTAEYRTFRRLLLGGTLVTVLLAGVSLLVLALEEVRARRRPLAVLAAGGVPRGTVVRSLLWRNAVPLLLAVVVAVVTGAGLGLLLLRSSARPLVLDYAGMGVLSAGAVVMVLLVTLCTLPAVRRATGATGLRVE